MSTGAEQTFDVAVIGAGPAGAAAALGLAMLGWRVRMYTGDGRSGLEGGSARLPGALQSLSLRSACANVDEMVPRICHWAGERWKAGEEHVIDRTRFDAALRADVAREHIDQVNEHVRATKRLPGGWLVVSDRGTSRARAVIDARGRRTRAAGVRGPRLLASMQRYSGSAVRSTTVLCMGAGGWYWAAVDGQGDLQVVAVTGPEHSKRSVSPRQPLLAGNALPNAIAEVTSGAVPAGPPRACAATSVWRSPAEQEGYVFSGDAALSVDPLSGNGMYEALAASPAAIAGVNTWLKTGEWCHVRRFLTERSRESWMRKLEVAGSFYEQAARVAPHPFWARTASAYRARGAEFRTTADGPIGVERRPVLIGSRIELRRVIVGPRWPRGLWRFRDIELADLIESSEPELSTAARLGVDVSQVREAVQWLSRERVFARGAEPAHDRIESIGSLS